MSPPGAYLRRRRCTLVILAGLVPSGLLTKYYRGYGEEWVNHSLGGVLYVIFWVLFFSLLFPRVSHWKIALYVFLATSAVELLQLWHPPWLEAIRANPIGVTLLGNSFTWLDFPHYLVGSLLAGFLLSRLHFKEVAGRK